VIERRAQQLEIHAGGAILANIGDIGLAGRHADVGNVASHALDGTVKIAEGLHGHQGLAPPKGQPLDAGGCFLGA
jgi:hypothetical protein